MPQRNKEDISRKEVHPHTINYIGVGGKRWESDAEPRACSFHRDRSVTELKGLLPFQQPELSVILNPDFLTLDILSALSMPLLNISDRHYTNWLVKRVEKPTSNPSQWPYSLKWCHWRNRGQRTKRRGAGLLHISLKSSPGKPSQALGSTWWFCFVALLLRKTSATLVLPVQMTVAPKQKRFQLKNK